MSPPLIERATVSGPAGAIETVIEESDSARAYAVVCHPHPLYGGTMENKVVTSLARALREAGVSTVRFNFRGVGKSDGVYDEGVGETADAAAVATSGALRWPGLPLVIAGFSFGAYVSLRLAQELRASHLITIAPPVIRFDFEGLKVPACPWLIVQGDADDVVDPGNVIDWVASLEPKPDLVIMPGVGHFFHGQLLELRETVRAAVAGSRGG